MKPWLKWILVIPAAIGACVGMQILVLFGDMFAHFFGATTGVWLPQLMGAILCPIAFVSTVAAIAPEKRYTTAVCLTVVITVFSTAVATWVFVAHLQTTGDFIWLILCGIAGIAASIYVCATFHEEERQML